nr:hypothetical protein [Tanacetum cinerariifolium]
MSTVNCAPAAVSCGSKSRRTSATTGPRGTCSAGRFWACCRREISQALDVGDGRFEVVRGHVHERVQVHVGAREVGVALVQLGIGELQRVVDGGQLRVEVVHLLAGQGLLGSIGGVDRHAHR